MNNSKIDFISDLLAHKNIRVSEKERLLMLTREELKNVDSGSEDVMKRLSEIEKELENLKWKTSNDKEVSEDTEKLQVIDLSKHKPLDVTTFLSKFKTGYGLKFLTHAYDVPGTVFERSEILQKAKKEYEDLIEKLSINYGLKARVKMFILGIGKYNSWYFNSQPYHLNWESKEIIDWCNKNPGVHPIDNDVFNNKMIKPFKESIEIKSQESPLDKLIKEKASSVFGSDYLSFRDKLEFIDVVQADFVTDVDALLTGIGCLFNTIKQRKANGTHVKIRFEKKARKRTLQIVHTGSSCTKSLSKEELFGGDLNNAEKAFFQVCDWSIMARTNENKYEKLNILFDMNSNTIEKEIVNERDVEGFTHILTFNS